MGSHRGFEYRLLLEGKRAQGRVMLLPSFRAQRLCAGNQVSKGDGERCWRDYLACPDWRVLCPSRSDLGLSDLNTGPERDPTLAGPVLGAALELVGGDLPHNSLQTADRLPCWSHELLFTLSTRVSRSPGRVVPWDCSLSPLQKQPWLSDRKWGPEVHIRCFPLCVFTSVFGHRISH